MKTEIETKTIYISDDGKKQSYNKNEVARYEERQSREIFERRTRISNISTSTSLYCFAKGDIESFKNFYPEVYLEDIEDDENGCFVCVYDSSYDNIGEDYHLYREGDYKDLIRERVNYLISISDRIDSRITARNTLEV